MREAGHKGPPQVAEFGAHYEALRLNTYIAQAQGGAFKVVKDLGAIDPKERVVGGAEAHPVSA